MNNGRFLALLVSLVASFPSSFGLPRKGNNSGLLLHHNILARRGTVPVAAVKVQKTETVVTVIIATATESPTPFIVIETGKASSSRQQIPSSSSQRSSILTTSRTSGNGSISTTETSRNLPIPSPPIPQTSSPYPSPSSTILSQTSTFSEYHFPLQGAPEPKSTQTSNNALVDQSALSSSSPAPTLTSDALTPASKAGIGIGAALAITSIISSLYWVRRNRRRVLSLEANLKFSPASIEGAGPLPPPKLTPIVFSPNPALSGMTQNNGGLWVAGKVK